MKKRIVLLGPPASGKGTQAEMIRAKHKIETPSVGAILREQAAAGTPIGLEAEKFTRDGLLVPDAIIVALVESWLVKHDGSVVFDGFPRTVGQAEALEQMLNSRQTPLDIALFFELNIEAIEDRVARRLVCSKCDFIVSVGWQVESVDSPCPRCGGALHRRKDDTLEALQRRMIEYREKTEPLIGFYKKRGILRLITAHERSGVVFEKVCAALESQ